MSSERLPSDFDGARFIQHEVQSFNVRAVKVENVGQEIGPHQHSRAHFMLVLWGHYLRRRNSGLELLRPPFPTFDPAGTSHDDRFAVNEGSFLALSLPPGDDLPLAKEPCELIHGPALKRALGLARLACTHAPDAIALESAIWELLAAREEAPASTAIPRWALDAFDLLMEEAADAELTVKAVADRLKVHPVHLARVFRAAWDCAPSELLRWRRVERAAKLLEQGTMSAAEIAVMTGFSDQSHMSRMFKRHFGLGPSAWKQDRMFQEYKTGRHRAR